MAAEIELKKINEYVSQLVAVTSITGAYVYGVDSNGNSIKIAVDVLAAAGDDYSSEIADLQTRCGNNETLISELQSALRGKANAQHYHEISEVVNLQTALDGKAAAAHTHAQSDIQGLEIALQGKAAAVHTHNQSDIQGLEIALQGKAAAVHTHAQSDIQGLEIALQGKAAAVHTHEISDVGGLGKELSDITARVEDLEQTGGATNGVLKQRDLSTYAGDDSEIAQHRGTTTAELHDGWTYKCTVGEIVKTIAAGTDCIRFTQGGRSFVSDGSTEEYDVDCLFAVIEVDGVAYTLFEGSAVGSYVINHNCPKAEVPKASRYAWHDGATLETVTAVNGNSYTLSNGVTLVGASWGGDTTPALILYDEASGERYHGCYSSNFVGNRSLYLVSATTDSNGDLVPSEPLGTAFGGEKTVFTATEGIVIRAHSWTQHGTQPTTSVASGDAFLTLTNDELGASIDIAYNSGNQHLELKGKNAAVVSYVDMGIFIKDGMLDDAELFTTAEQGVSVEAPYLKFTFNVASGKSVIRVSLKDLVDIYDGANINLTSAFVKAATYSAPAIGDSMNVAIGKLLKGHEDNAAAIATKQDTLTFDNTPTTGSTKPVTSQGIKAAIDAAVGNVPNALKQEDLTTYQGTDGEIVQHTGVTTADYTNGYNYKCSVTSGASATSTYYRDKTFNEISLQSVDVPHIYRWNYRGYIEGHKILITPNRLPQAGDIAFEKDFNLSLQSQISQIVDDNTFIYVNGIEAVFVSDYVPLAAYRNEDGLVGFLCYDDQDNTCLYLPDSTTYNFVDVNIRSGTSEIVSWQQWNSQPSSEGAVSDLETRMTAAETAIQGKQPTITGAASTITSANLTASKALVSDANGKVAASSVTSTELGYLSGVSSAIQTQIGNKVDKVSGKGLSTNDYTNTEKTKLAGIAEGATAVTVDAELSASSANAIRNSAVDAGIKNAQRVFYAVTDTAGATAVKEFTIPNFPTETVNGVKTPLKGTILIAQCTNTDSRTAQLKFKVNDGGEFPIWHNLAEYDSTSMNDKVFGNSVKTYTYTFDGTHWCFVSHGSDNNTTYTAGTGLKLSGGQFSLNVPRVAKTANSLPGKNTATIEEYANGDNSNLPTNAWFHILTLEGNDANYATQLALGMTTNAAYYRYYYNGTWGSWKRLDNLAMDSTPTAGNTSNVVSSAGIKTYVDTQVATKSNVIFRQWVTQ